MLLMTELTEDVKYTTEEVVNESGEKKKNLYIEGIFLQAGVVNRNKRMYPTQVLANEVARYDRDYVRGGRAYGELGHPDGPKINLERVSHMVTELRQDGNNFYGKARITATPYGDIAKGLMESGARLGVSSRGLGTLKVNESGITEVQGDFRLAAAADIVADPSAPDAWVNGIMEGVEFVRAENSDAFKRVDRLKEEMRRMTVRKLEEQSVDLFKRFLKSISS